MKALVTGASGYIGERVVQLLQRAGHVVALAGRRPASGAFEWLPFDLQQPRALVLPEGTDVVVHLAAHTGSTQQDGSLEEHAARSLLDAARLCGARFVFVSSQTARSDAPTSYGRTKWRIEQMVLTAGGCVVRPGQVYGGAERGLFGTLVAIVRRLPVLPDFRPAPTVQPIHVDDLAQALLHAAERRDLGGSVLAVGAPEPVSFTEFLRAIAVHRLGVRRWFVPLPVGLVQALRRWSRGRIAPLERLGSLMALPAMHAEADLLTLGVVPRPLAAGLARRGRRRLLALEAYALLRYVLGARPGSGLIRRQVRAVERLRTAHPLALPRWLIRLPAGLALFEPRGTRDEELAWRLDCATAVAEASPQGARCFLGTGHGALAAAAGLALALAREFAERLLRLLAALHPRWRKRQ